MKTPGLSIDTLSSRRNRGPASALVPCIGARRRPSALDTDYVLLTQWRVDYSPVTGEVGEVWQLVNFDNKGQAVWRRLEYTTQGPAIGTITTIDGQETCASGTGKILMRTTVAENCEQPLSIIKRIENTLDFDIQVAKSLKTPPKTALSAGVCSFEKKDFLVSKKGHVKLAGGKGPSIQSLEIDSNSLPGERIVEPDDEGRICLSSSVVASAKRPVRIHSSKQGAVDLRIQLAAVGGPDSVGLSSYNNRHFHVDKDGHVSLANDGLSVNQIFVDECAGDGDLQVRPFKNGSLAISGSIVPNKGIPIQTISREPNQLNVEIQTARATDEDSRTLAGVASFEACHFRTSSKGHTSLAFPAGGPPGHTVNLSIAFEDGEAYVTSHNYPELSEENPAYVVTREGVIKITNRVKVKNCFNMSCLPKYERFPLFIDLFEKDNGTIAAHARRSRLDIIGTCVGSYAVIRTEYGLYDFLEVVDTRIYETEPGSFGADKHSYFMLNDASYAPTFTEGTVMYSIGKDDSVKVWCNLINCDKDGIGAVDAQIALPLPMDIRMSGEFVSENGGPVHRCSGYSNCENYVTPFLDAIQEPLLISDFVTGGPGTSLRLYGTGVLV